MYKTSAVCGLDALIDNILFIDHRRIELRESNITSGIMFEGKP